MLALADDDVHLWRLDCAAPFEPDDARLLEAGELERAARFSTRARQQRFITQRAWLRRVLALYLDQPAEPLKLSEGPRGKPFLASSTGIEFNLSHAEDLALVGVARVPLGVDVEMPRRVVAPLDLAARRFAPGELAWLQAGPAAELVPRFLRCWTRKEAFMKATGEGLARRLASFDVRPVAVGATRVATQFDDTPPWFVLDLDLGVGIAAALCSPLVAPRVSWPAPPAGHDDALRPSTSSG
ncbi:MAG: 4'-phosphopantetheinyl transferase superfamily protein [Gammaproteobacteria bacterium]|nr:4'-phosphopantetheinyl transferase superfamily protein [Gammaproteobacteria bacterium]